MILYLIRSYEQQQTPGCFVLFEQNNLIFDCKTLEPQWNFNMPFNSCIYEDVFKCKKKVSPTYGLCFEVLNVKARTNILGHWGNFRDDTQGCILVGKDYIDINRDGLKDVTNSQITFNNLMEKLPNEFILVVTSDQTAIEKLHNKA